MSIRRPTIVGPAMLSLAIFCLAPVMPPGKALMIYPSSGGTYVVFEHGLGRQDGLTWHMVLATPTDKVTSLHTNGNLLCAGTFNGFLHFIGDSGTQSLELPVQTSGAPYTVNGIAFAKGKWWASTLEGSIFRVAPSGSFDEHVLREPKSGKPKNVIGLVKDNNGYLWVESLDGIYFLTDIHKSKQRKLGFLASDAYGHPVSRLVESPHGIYVLSNAGGKLPKLYLGTLSPALMDAIKKEIALPEEFNAQPVVDMVFALDHLWLRGQGSLYRLNNYHWEQIELIVSAPIDGHGFSPEPNQVWVLSQGQLQALSYR